MMKLSERTKGIKPSITLALAAKAAAMRAQGIGVINFAAGEPDFDTPDRIKEAAVQALKKGDDQVHRSERYPALAGDHCREIPAG